MKNIIIVFLFHMNVFSICHGQTFGSSKNLGISDGEVTTGKVGDGAITTSKMGEGLHALYSSAGEISDGEITTSKIGSGAVTTSKLGTDLAHTGTFTTTALRVLSGALGLASKSIAQLEAITSTAGDVYYCSDCLNAVHVVVGTGTISGFDSLIGGTAWHN